MRVFIIIFLISFTSIGQTIRYASPSGSGSANGTSQDNEWSYSQAFANATAGMTVYMRKGSSGTTITQNNNGTSGSPIKFIGYNTTINDVTTTAGSTFSVGDVVSSSTMPLLDNNSFTGTMLRINGNFVEIENLQITRANIGVLIYGNNVKLRNVIITQMGDQATYSSYTGFGIQIYGNNVAIDNSYVQNCGAEAINGKGGLDGRVNNTYVYASNASNPTDYYNILGFGSSGWIFDGCTVHRVQSLAHGGHGFMGKDQATNNIFRNSTVIGSSLEVNFSGVTNNLFENIKMYGYGTGGGEWHTRIFIANGANNNTFRNIYMENTWASLQMEDYNDGYVGPGGDRDLESAGYDNLVENLIVKNTDRVINIQAVGGGSLAAKSERFTLKNATIFNANTLKSGNIDGVDFDLINVGVHTQNTSNFTPSSLTGVTYTNCAYFNATDTSWSTGWSALGNPLLVNAALEDVGFKLQAGSPWINAGSNTGSTTGYGGAVVNGTRDVGAYEYSTGAPTDTTAPIITNRVVFDITTSSFKVDWSLNEGSKGRLEYGLTTSYGNLTTQENNYLSRHIQPISGLTAGTLYHYRILGEDASGNVLTSGDFTATTLSSGSPIELQVGDGSKAKFLKLRKN